MARGNIRQRCEVRKDSWTVQIHLGRDPDTGKIRYHSEAVKGTKAQAERRLTELLREKDTGTFTKPSKLTVGEYLEQWFRDYVATHVRQRTQEGYRGNLDRYILPRIGNVPLEKLTPRHVEEMEAELLRDGGSRTRGRGLSPTTVLQVHRILSNALEHAVKLGMVARNVAKAVDPPRVAKYEAHTLDQDQSLRFLEQIESPLYGTLILVALQTGLRRSEILGLRWMDVNLPASTLSVQRALIKLLSGSIVVTAPKSGRARVVDLPDQSVEALKNLKEKHPDVAGNGDFVFCHSDGTALDPDWVTGTFRRMSKKAGLENFRFHDLRHTHATLMIALGEHIKVISERLGHSSIAITLDLYAHVLPTVQKEAVERFGKAWSMETGTGMAKEWQNNVQMATVS